MQLKYHYSETFEYKPPVVVEESDGFFQEIEKIMSGFIMSIAKTLNWMVSASIKKTLTIDDIVFNLYDEIRLDYWNNNSNSSIIKILKDPINTWYSFFQSIAVVGYMVILVYVGIKILLQSTSASKKANYKKTFMYWVVGIAVLFFMPYYMKYIISLNDAFVTQIADSRSNKAKKAERANIDLSAGYLSTDFDNVIGFHEGSDYMTMVGKLADSTEKLGLAIAYIIMVWQLIVMLIYYYKRVFIIGFLIVIFPMIALTFVWDKLNDGKSQALSAWMQEFTIGVFVQSFHAIIFVFVCNTIYETIDFGTNSIDFILVMIASSFLFSGEEILKQIFGGSKAEAVGSLSQTAGRLALTTAVATKVGARFVNNAIGEKGVVRSGAKAFNDIRLNNRLLKKDASGRTNFEKVATRPKVKRNVTQILPATSSDVYPDEIKSLADVIATLNDFDKASSEEIANALNEYKKLSAMYRNGMSPDMKRMFDEVMAKSNFSPEQLDKLNHAMVTTAVMASSGRNTTKQISQHLKMEVEITFPPDESGKNVSNKMYKAALLTMRDHGVSRGVTKEHLAQKWNSKREQIKDFDEIINFGASTAKVTGSGVASADTSGTTNGATSRAANTVKVRAQGIVERYKQNHQDENVDNTKVFRISENVAIIENLDKNIITATEASKAFREIDNNADKNAVNELLSISNVGADYETIKYVVAKKIVSDHSITPMFVGVKETDEDSTIKWAKQVSDGMEKDAIDSLNDNNLNIRRESKNVDDPYIMILDILAGTSRNGTINVANVKEVYEKSALDASAQNSGWNRLFDISRAENQNDIMSGMDFAKEALKEEDIYKDSINGLLYDGKTFDEIKETRDIAFQNFAANVGKGAADIVASSVGAFIGVTGGIATTDDGMPFGEAINGLVAGTNFGAYVGDKAAPYLSGQKERDNKEKKLEDTVKKRLKSNSRDNDTTDYQNERALYENSNQDTGENLIVLRGLRANMFQDPNGTLSASVMVQADNVDYVYVSEDPVFPSTGWIPYQDSVLLTFKDNDPKKPHDIYAYVKDKYGNVKGARLTNITM